MLTATPVERILVKDDRASGVALASGEQLSAAIVISNADPKTTFLGLLGAEHLDAGFVRRVTHLRTRGITAKLHLALHRLPQFTGVQASALRGRLLVAPNADYIERAYNHAKYEEYSQAPMLEVTLPSLADPALAPAGKHVASVVVQYAPYALKEGWAAGRQRFTDIVIDTLERLCAGPAPVRGGERAVDACGHRARVPHQRRSLAPRGTGLRPVLHGAPGSGHHAVPDSAAGTVPVWRGLPPRRGRDGTCRAQRGAAGHE